MKSDEKEEKEESELPKSGAKEVLSYDVAKTEVGKWLDAKQVSDKRREHYSAHIEVMISAFQQGIFTMNSENKKITHKLLFPLADGKGLQELVYLPRVPMDIINQKLEGTSGFDQRMQGFAAAVCSQVRGLLGKLDSEDYGYTLAVANFFT